jgi:hypothetical protein
MAMLRSNLATRPFYNERLVSLAIVLGIVAVVALTAFNVSQIMSLSKERAVFKAAQEKDDKDAAVVSAGAQAVQRSVDAVRLVALGRQTREANELIDQRTFSWTQFFGHVEQTLPLDARLIAVAPRVARGEFLITMIVNGKAEGDLEDFIEQLLGTGAFYDVSATALNMNDDNTVNGTIVAHYYLAPKALKTAAPAAGKGR